MARVKGALNAKKKHNRVLKLAKGYRGARSKQYRVAKQSVMRALTSAFAGRKQKKRDMRSLWITRINAAARINGLSYSNMMVLNLQALISTERCLQTSQLTILKDLRHLQSLQRQRLHKLKHALIKRYCCDRIKKSRKRLLYFWR